MAWVKARDPARILWGTGWSLSKLWSKLQAVWSAALWVEKLL